MRSDGRPAGEAVHATALAVGGQALLITGRSGAGKSRLALALIAASTRRCPVRLIGDDRILLMESARGLVARGHPRLQGFIERRGFGILASPFVERAPVRAIVQLGPKTSRPTSLQNFPCLSIVTLDDTAAARIQVLGWWRCASTTQVAKPPAAA